MKKYDVIVAGAGVSGFAAAIGARQAGASVLLLDREHSAGGTAVYALTPVLSGWHDDRRIGGVADMLIEYLEKNNAVCWRSTTADTEEDILQQAMLTLLEEAGVEMLFDAELTGATCIDNRITSIQVQHNNTIEEFTAGTFVDATGDAVLAEKAGALLSVPPAELSMTKTLMFKVKNLHSFDKVSIKKRFKEKTFPVPHQNEFMGTQLLNENEAILNLTAAIGNAADSSEYARMEEELAGQIPVITEWLRREFPEFADIEIVKIAPKMGVRYTRSIVGQRQLSWDDMANVNPPEEPVATCGPYIGGHYINGFSSPWGNAIPGNPAIPYGALRSKNIDNLLACGRIIDVDPRVVSAIRLCANCMASGQAAGIAAALNIPEYSILKKELDKQNCRLTKKETFDNEK